jgi:hypothetical protein
MHHVALLVYGQFLKLQTLHTGKEIQTADAEKANSRSAC